MCAAAAAAAVPAPPPQSTRPVPPQLLTKQVERDILPVLAALADMGCSEADVQLLVWEFPRIFVSSNWRRHVRKFQVGLWAAVGGRLQPASKQAACAAASFRTSHGS